MGKLLIMFVHLMIQTTSTMNCQDCKYRILNQLFNIFYHAIRWKRSCELLENKLYNFANNTKATGWLGIVGHGAETHSSLHYRIPGTEFKYQCSNGFYIENKTNPIQMLQCQGNGLVDTSFVTSCIGKVIF